MKVIVTHSADIQVKNRNINLYQETLATLKKIEEYVEYSKSKIHIISGDLFEYAVANEIERNLIYNHICRLLNIKTLEELIIIDGNHDLVKENKKTTDENALSIISSVLDTINNEVSHKLKYIKKCEVIESSVCNDILFIPYALERRSEWEELTKIVDSVYSDDRVKICLYHAMLREYAQEAGLPLQPNQLNKLDSINLFPKHSKIFAGDIHVPFVFSDKENDRTFIYPGATMQHTFGEGEYISVSDEVKIKQAPSKKINIYQIDTDKIKVGMSEMIIPNYVQYLTIRLDSNVPYDLIKYNLTNLDNSIINSENKTCYIRIKSSNIFITKEKEIFDIIKNKFNTNVHIQFEYDKFVQTSETSDNKIIQDLVDNKLEELNIEKSQEKELLITNDNIDNLILTNEQCIKLFDDILNQTINKLTGTFDYDIKENDVYSDILALFRTQLGLCTEKSSQRFNIHFDFVSCNNFMILGDNHIDLCNKGITRILGTNGIGKTTLYRLIRWIITGQIIEGMKSNQAVQNNLMVFNKNLPNNNEVKGTLELTINGQKVILERIAIRKWKSGVSEENMLSQNWTDFVSNVERSFKLTIYPTDMTKEPKVFVGEQAEKTISNWFGETINTILFLDQNKIKSILNTPAAKLNETILNYIGIDYLEKLEANLDGVKEDLMSIRKPLFKREEIQEKLIDCDILINKAKEESENLNKSKETCNYEIKEIQKDINSKHDEIIEFGHIPNMIKDSLQTISEEENNLLQLEKLPQEIKEKPIFVNVEIKLNDELISENNQNIDSCKNVIEEYTNKKDNVLTIISDIESKQKVLMSNEIDKTRNLLNALIEEKNIYENEQKQYYDVIRKELQLTLDALRLKYQEKQNIKNEYEFSIKNLENDCKHYEDELKNGYCPTCKRQYDNFTDADKNKIMDNLKKAKSLIESNNKELSTLNVWFEQFKGVEEKCNRNYNYAYNSNYLLFNDEKIVIKYKEQYLLITELIKKIDKNSEDIKSTEIYLKSILNSEYINKTDNLNEFEQEYHNLSEQIKINQDLILSYSKIIDEQNQKIKEYQIIIDKENYRYKTAFEKYQKAYSEWQEICNNIDKENQSVNKNINNILNTKTKIEMLKSSHKSLEEKLSKYEELNNQYIILQESIKNKQNELQAINDNFTRQQVKITSYENQKEQLRKEYDELIQYQKNQIIWKIYQKLIKTTFKNIVFEYYRVFLNNTLNHLLSDVSFKLYWNKDSQLTMVNVKNGIITYQPVQLSSGMETTFLGLSLIYCIGLLNVKNTVSNLFIDEISGTLNKGKELSYIAEDYQELFVKILHKFTDKNVFIVEHSISDIKEDVIYEVVPKENYSIYVRK